MSPSYSLTCTLYHGFNITHGPYLVIEGYDTITAGSVLSFSVARIKNNAVESEVRIGVRTHYPDGLIGSLYSNTSELLPAGTAYSVSTCTLTLTYSAGTVLSATTFSITVTPSASITSTDYFIAELPSDMVDGLNQFEPVCSNCQSVEVYYAASLLRFYPASTHLAGSSRTYSFTNLSTPAFRMSAHSASIVVKSFMNDKARDSCTSAITLAATECSSFNFTVGSVSSLGGLSLGVSYSFSFKTNHRVPASGAITIEFPAAFGVLGGHTCISALGCSATARGLTLTFSGELAPSSTYAVTLAGVTNPNSTLSGQAFTISSWASSNVFLGRMICTGTAPAPSLVAYAGLPCTLAVLPRYLSASATVQYAFGVTCQDEISEGELLVQLPSEVASLASPSPSCESQEPTTLASRSCLVVGRVLAASLRAGAGQKTVTVLAELTNPSSGDYQFTASLTRRGAVYSRTAPAIVTYSSQPFVNSTVPLSLRNTPTEAGAFSTYLLLIPMIEGSGTVDTFRVKLNSSLDFTHAVDLRLLALSTSLGLSTLSGSAIAELMNSPAPANAQVLFEGSPSRSETELTFKATVQLPVSSVLLAVRGVINPSTPSNFKLEIDCSGNGGLLWTYSRSHELVISEPADYLLLAALSASDYDTRYPSNLLLTLTAPNNGSVLPAGSFQLRVLLPPSYQQVLYAASALTCALDSVATPCSLQGQLVQLTVLVAVAAEQLTLQISGLVNPVVETVCLTEDTLLLRETTVLLEVEDSAGNVRQNKPVSAISNCLPFKNVRRNLEANFPTIINAGLIYSYSFSINVPTNNLIVSVTSNCSELSFNPSNAAFTSFTQKTAIGEFSARSDSPNGLICRLQFLNYDQNLNLYKYILPLTLNVTANALTQVPLTIGDDQSRLLGQAVNFTATLAQPISSAFAVMITLNSIPGFLTVEPTRMEFAMGATTSTFSVAYTGSRVPPQVELDFSILSSSGIPVTLPVARKYLTFYQDPDRTTSPPLLLVKLTDSKLSSGEVGQPVLTALDSKGENYRPVVRRLVLTERQANSASFQLTTNSDCRFSYVLLEKGQPVN